MPELRPPVALLLGLGMLATLLAGCGGPGARPPGAAAEASVEVDVEEDQDEDQEVMTGAQLVHSYCGACHSRQLVEAQRLDRNTWNWVLDDMIEEYGARWVTDEERSRIVDHLVEHYGPEP